MRSFITLIALLGVACGGSPRVGTCEQNPKACLEDGNALVADLAEPQHDARALRDRAVRYFELACEHGDKPGCARALSFWAHREKAKAPPDDAIDGVTSLPVQGADERAANAQVTREKIVALTRRLEQLSFADAKKARNEAALTAFLKQFPHGELTKAAEDEIVALAFEPIAKDARATRKVDKVLDFAEAHKTFAVPKDVLIELGTEGRTRAELSRIVALDAEGASPAFRNFVKAARDKEAELALREAAKEDGDRGVAALRAFRTQYAWSPKAEEAKPLEEERAFAAATGKTGAEAVAAFRAFQTDYPKSARLADARANEVRAATELARRATNAAQYWAYLKDYANEPDAPAIRSAFADYLLKPDTQEAAAEYEKYLEQNPTTPKKAALAKKMRDVKRKETSEFASVKRTRDCASSCESDARSKCSSLADEGPTGPRALCVSNALRPCCARCNMTIDSSTFAACK